MQIRNPVTWVVAQFGAAEELGSEPAPSYFGTTASGVPPLRRIGVAEVWRALRLGWGDIGAGRADLVMLWLIYPAIVAYLWEAVYHGDLIPLLLPLASGFALVGPIFAVGMYEMSRKREIDGEMHWTDGFGVLRSPSLGAIVGLSLALIALFGVWLAVAIFIANAFLGPAVPAGLGFFAVAFGTAAGWSMLGVGAVVGALFAILALIISSVSFPLLLDRPVTLGVAIRTSARAIRLNTGPIVLWGAVVVVGLVVGSIPIFAGLIVVLPILGHGTWHLYRAMVPKPPAAAQGWNGVQEEVHAP